MCKPIIIKVNPLHSYVLIKAKPVQNLAIQESNSYKKQTRTSSVRCILGVNQSSANFHVITNYLCHATDIMSLYLVHKLLLFLSSKLNMCHMLMSNKLSAALSNMVSEWVKLRTQYVENGDSKLTSAGLNGLQWWWRISQVGGLREQWNDYSLEAGTTEKNKKVQAATLMTVMGRECFMNELSSISVGTERSGQDTRRIVTVNSKKSLFETG